MCIIIDANAAHQLDGERDSGVPVLKWLLYGSGKLVVSSELLREIRAGHFLEVVQALEQAGKLVRADEKLCLEETKGVKEKFDLRSNDGHIIGLVKASSCDLVFTGDKPLHDDLKNRDVIGFKVRIYQDESHKHLLSQCKCI